MAPGWPRGLAPILDFNRLFILILPECLTANSYGLYLFSQAELFGFPGGCIYHHKGDHTAFLPFFLTFLAVIFYFPWFPDRLEGRAG